MTNKTVEKAKNAPIERPATKAEAKAEAQAAADKAAAKAARAAPKADAKSEVKAAATPAEAAKTTPAKAVDAPEATKVVEKETTAVKNDLFAVIAREVEQTPKTAIDKLLVTLTKENDVNSFRVGGLLQRVLENGWFGEFESFGEYVFENFGFRERKARYLIEIYSSLVSNMIPYDKVEGLGWTKLKELAKFLTLDNVDEWVKKAQGLSVSELKSLIAGENKDDDAAVKPTSDVQSMNFKVHPDQSLVIESALNKAKVDVDTEHDNVALETVCGSYLQPHEAKPMQLTDEMIIKYLQRTDVAQAVGLVQKAHPSLEVHG